MHSPKPKNLSGYDGIKSTNLKACAHLFSNPFRYICNPRYIRVFLLTCLKVAVIKLFYKKGDKTSIRK